MKSLGLKPASSNKADVLRRTGSAHRHFQDPAGVDMEYGWASEDDDDDDVDEPRPPPSSPRLVHSQSGPSP